MKIKLTSVFVDDQDKALKFYTQVLGFEKKGDIPVGEFKWLTVVSPEEREGTELLLEPDDNPAAQTFKKNTYMTRGLLQLHSLLTIFRVSMKD
jgi:catechol 2,3-dioxygenase-like lactoylglutathione lyase family enzyme